MKESQLQKQIKDFLNWRGWPCRRNNNIGIYDPSKGIMRKTHQKGMPDLSAIITRKIVIAGKLVSVGQIMDIEVKVKPNKATPEQLLWLEKTNKAGGIAVLAYSLEDVKKALNKHGIAT